MKIHDANWMQVEAYLKRDDRAVLPIGSTEQHAGLSLMVDSILAERVSAEAAEPLGVPVFPPLSYGITPYFMGFPGTVSLRVETLIHVVRDVLDSPVRPRLPPLRPRQRPWRQPAGAVLCRRMGGRPSGQPREVPQLVERAEDLGGGEGDRSRRLARLLDGEFPVDARSPASRSRRSRSRWSTSSACALMNPKEVRAHIGDGNFGGYYERSDDEMLRVWNVAVEETRALIDGGW